jgi:hypothetical protein
MIYKRYYLHFQVLVISFWYFSEAYGVKKNVLAVDLIFSFSERKESLLLRSNNKVETDSATVALCLISE